jgi:hypothetical protein
MSIPVTCGRCFQSFNVRDEFAGRTIRCKDCGAAMAVSWDAAPSQADDFVPPRPRKRKRTKRPSAAPKVAAIVVGCLFGVALLGTGIWFAVVQISKSSKSDRATENDANVHRFGQIRFECPKNFVVNNRIEGQYNVEDKEKVIAVSCQEHPVPADIAKVPKELLGHFRNWVRDRHRRILASRMATHRNGFEYVFVEYETGSGRDLLKGWHLLIPTPDGKVIFFDAVTYPPLTPWEQSEPIIQKIVDSIRIRD